MGDVSDATNNNNIIITTKKKKKKGRPSLLDLQKRSLKKQQQNHNLLHSHSNLHHQDDDDERTQKKQKLLIRLNSYHSTPSNTRNIHHQTDGKVLKATESKDGSQGESGPTTPLPDKKLLLFILDRLQKKDTHDVFSEPVDPEELPDYHDIIKNPMDFGTVRNKLDGGLYANLETFENDVFLICSNAMQYNSPDTIYHRQARAMQEIAKKDFENLRQESDSDSELQPKPQHKIVQRGRPPGKNIIKSLAMSPSDRVGPESSSDATLASGRDIASGSNVYNLRKALSKFQPADSSVRASYGNLNSGGYTSWSYDWENEFPASVLKAVLRYGKKQSEVDETRRDTYNHPVALRNEPPLVATVEDELKQLLAVGLHVKHSYARSLAHFAADLGPVAWKIAARKISSVLPRGHEFGPGWVAEDNVSQKQHFPACDDERTSDPPVPEDYKSSFPNSSGSFPVVNRPFLQSGDMVMNREINYENDLNPVNNVGGGIESMIPLRMQQESMVRSDDFGSNCRPGSNFSPQMKMVRLADLTGSTNCGNVPQMLDMDSISSHMAPANINQPLRGQFLNKLNQLDSSNLLALESGFESQSLCQGLAGKSSWQGMEVPTNQSPFSLANDLNGKNVATNSGSSSVETGSQRQPNLALQL
ncbi:putative chromatin remodeler Bromodomain family [Lupinus albus]|uniref:Putative chromatin remodeler Bromodomain family n=1 Tax=Lupinus albus TaxID=3870 RepID=A0A6A4N258_LUPAL|nr:putative chromatin remodeler Bromodomain family [Lupinus albus]